jgi:hypothetical protein
MLCVAAPGDSQALAPGQAVRILEVLTDGRAARISSRNVVEKDPAS